jgi:hypothetical protein
VTTATASLPVAAAARARPVADRRFATGAAALLLAITLLPFVLAVLGTPPGARFTGEIGGSEDANVYYAFIHQARDGHWLFVNPLTLEPHGRMFVNVQWLLLGKLQALTGATDLVVGQLWRLGGAVVLLGAFWLLAATFFTGWPRRIAFLAFATGGGFGWLFWALHVLGIATFKWDYYYAPGGVRTTPADVFFNGIPFNLYAVHGLQTASHALFLVGMLAFLRGETTGRARFHVGAGLATLALGLSHPYEFSTLLATFGVYALLTVHELRAAPRAAVRRLLPFAVAAPAVAYSLFVYAWHPVFRGWTESNVFPPHSPLHTFVAFGLAAALTVWRFPAFLATGRAGRRAHLVVVAWLVGNLAVYYAYPILLYTAQTRVTLMAPLVLIGLSWLPDRWPWLATRRGAALTVGIVLALNALSPALGYAQRLRLVLDARLSPVIYVDADLLAACRWLAAHAAPADVVLAPPALGSLVARESGARVYPGHNGPTVGYRGKAARAAAFYAGATEAERDALVDTIGARYVLAVAGTAPAASTLGEVFRQGRVRIYEVRDRG